MGTFSPSAIITLNTTVRAVRIGRTASAQAILSTGFPKKCAIISIPGKKERIGEEKHVAKRLLDLDIPILYSVVEPGTIETGGETIWLDHNTLLVGNTYRTNTHAYTYVLSAPNSATGPLVATHYSEFSNSI